MITEAVQLAGCLVGLFGLVGLVSAALRRMIANDSHDYDEKHVWFRRMRD